MNPIDRKYRALFASELGKLKGVNKRMALAISQNLKINKLTYRKKKNGNRYIENIPKNRNNFEENGQIYVSILDGNKYPLYIPKQTYGNLIITKTKLDNHYKSQIEQEKKEKIKQDKIKKEAKKEYQKEYQEQKKAKKYNYEKPTKRTFKSTATEYIIKPTQDEIIKKNKSG